MNTLKQCLRLSAIFMMLLILACKKNKIQKTETPPQKEPEKVCVPIKLETDGLILNLKYKENSNLLNAIEGSDGEKTLISYTPEQKPSKLEKFKNGVLYRTVFYEKDNMQSIKRAVLFSYDHVLDGYIPQGDYTFQYNNNNLPAEIKYHNSAGNPVKLHGMTYHSSGNLTNVSILNYPDQTSTVKYTSDDRKGIAMHISKNWLFALESEHWFLSSAPNNILSCTRSGTGAEQLSFSYEYDAEGYPSKMSITRNKTVQQIKITYKELPLQSVQ